MENNVAFIFIRKLSETSSKAHAYPLKWLRHIRQWSTLRIGNHHMYVQENKDPYQ
jgi:hypothetical protein